MRVNYNIMIGGLLSILLLSIVGALSINFENPTPASGFSNISIYINVSSDEVGDHYIFTDWNNSTLAWWMFDYNDGYRIVYDNSSFGRHAYNATAVFNATNDISPGYWGSAGNFSTASPYLRADNISGVDNSSTYTISLWIYKSANPASRQYIWSNIQGLFYPYISLETSGGLLIRYHDAIYSSTPALSNGWHHVVAQITKCASGTTVYWIDGVKGTSAACSSADYGSTSYHIGKSFTNLIDDIIIFNRTLSDNEAKALYNASANKYYSDFTSQGLAGNSYVYKSYIINKSSSFNSTNERTFTLLKGISSIGSPQYPDRYYLSPVSFNMTTNFDVGSCRLTLDEGVTNFTMSSADNRTFNYTNLSLTPEKYTVKFYCNDSAEEVTAQRNFSVSDHLTYFVDKSSSSCIYHTSGYSKNYATNESTPYCNISTSMRNIEAGDEIVVKYGDYCEGIVASTGKSGTADKPIILRGESNEQRTILNGTCANSTSNGIYVLGQDFWTFKYFFVYNFTNDGLNVHASGVDNALNITFENLTSYKNGWMDDTTPGAPGDGASAHENCTVIGRWLNLSWNEKSGITDINGVVSYYYDLHVENPENWGVYFGTPGWDNQYNHLERATIKNTPLCVKTESNLTAVDLYCYNSTGGGGGIQIADDTASINRFIVNNTISTSPSVSISNADKVELIDGVLDRNLSVINTPIVIATNVSYNLSLEDVDASSVLYRKFYLYVTSNIEGVSISIVNSSGDEIYANTTNASLEIARQNLTSYVNDGGTRTYYSDYTISASKSGYTSQTRVINLTDNSDIYFELVAEPSNEETSSSGGVLPTYYPLESDLLNGYSRTLGENWRMSFRLKNETHELKVDSILNNSAKITISSNPMTFSLRVNETKKIDFDKDGFYDLSVMLRSTSGSGYYSRADIYIQSIGEKVLESETSSSNEEGSGNETLLQGNGENFSNNNLRGWYLYVIAGILLIALAVFLVLKFKSKY